MEILAAGSSSQELAFACTLIIVNSFGFIFNLLIIYMFVCFKQKILTSDKNLLLLSMSIADFLVGISGIGGGITFLFMKKGSTTVIVYKIGGILPLFGSLFMSILCLGIMTTDRLVSVTHPIRHRLITTRKRIKIAICMCWLTVTALMAIQGILFFFVSAWMELQVRSLLLGIFFIGGSIVLSVSNTALYRSVQRLNAKNRVATSKVQPSGQPTQDPDSTETQSYEAVKRKDQTNSARVCIWMTVVFIVCWLPVTIYYIVWLALTANPTGRIGLTVCLALVGFNSVMNPVIYLLLRKDFRSYFWQMIFW